LIDISQKRRPIFQKTLPSKPSNQRIPQKTTPVSDSETEDEQWVVSDPETVTESESTQEVTLVIEESQEDSETESSDQEEDPWVLHEHEFSEAESEEQLLDMVVSEHFSIYNNWSSEEERWISDPSDQEQVFMIELPSQKTESDTEEDRHGYESDNETMDEETEEEKEHHDPVPCHQQPFKVESVSPLPSKVEPFDHAVELLRTIAKQNKETNKSSSDQLMSYLLNASKRPNDKVLLTRIPHRHRIYCPFLMLIL
jgi:hypothetical protein